MSPLFSVKALYHARAPVKLRSGDQVLQPNVTAIGQPVGVTLGFKSFPDWIANQKELPSLQRLHGTSKWLNDENIPSPVVFHSPCFLLISGKACRNGHHTAGVNLRMG